MTDILASISAWIDHTQVLTQIRNVDVKGLFQNSYFLVPFIAVIIYNLYKQAVNNLVIIAVCLGLWYLSGTDYVRGAVVDGEIQISKILPLAGVGVGGVATVVYLLFIRSE